MAFLSANLLLGVMLTLVVFYVAQKIYQRFNATPLLHPVLVSVVVIVLLLLLFDIEYSQYMTGGQVIHFFLGPATVALA